MSELISYKFQITLWRRQLFGWKWWSRFLLSQDVLRGPFSSFGERRTSYWSEVGLIMSTTLSWCRSGLLVSSRALLLRSGEYLAVTSFFPWGRLFNLQESQLPYCNFWGTWEPCRSLCGLPVCWTRSDHFLKSLPCQRKLILRDFSVGPSPHSLCAFIC